MRRISSSKIKILVRHFKNIGLLTKNPRVIAIEFTVPELHSWMDTYNSLHHKFLRSGKEVIVPSDLGGHKSTDYFTEGGALFVLKEQGKITILGEAAKVYFTGKYHLNKYNYLIIIIDFYKVPNWVEINGIDNLEEFELSLALLHEFCHVVELEGGKKILMDDPREYFPQTLKILNDLPSEYKKGFMNISYGAKGEIKFILGDKELV